MGRPSAPALSSTDTLAVSVLTLMAVASLRIDRDVESVSVDRGASRLLIYGNASLVIKAISTVDTAETCLRTSPAADASPE